MTNKGGRPKGRCGRDLSGAQYGDIRVIQRSDRISKSNSVYWLCQCKCGYVLDIRADNLIGRPPCSGLHKYERHGHTAYRYYSPTYNSWRAMRNRCANPKHPRFDCYGGRGITVSDDWNVFHNFLADMGERPEGTTIDRINVNGHYTNDNCRWATPEQQRANKRRAR